MFISGEMDLSYSNEPLGQVDSQERLVPTPSGKSNKFFFFFLLSSTFLFFILFFCSMLLFSLFYSSEKGFL